LVVSEGLLLKAAILHRIRNIQVEDIPVPEISENEVLIKVAAAGICGTDLHFFRGEWNVKMPIVPGHEFSGEIIKVGEDAKEFSIGDRVVVEPNILCGSCYFCRMPERNFFCENLIAIGVDTDGAFAEYVRIKKENVYKFPEHISFEEAAFIEPVACCLRGLDNVKIKMGDSVAIIGAGPIGLLLLQLAKKAGASKTIQTDYDDARLELAEKLGADYTINVKKQDPMLTVKELTKGYGMDVAIEAVGSPEAITQAMRVTRRGGRLNIFGVSPQNATWEVKPFDLYNKELTITSSYRSPFTFQKAVEIVSSGELKLKPLISHIFPIDEIEHAFKILDEKLEKAIKIIIKP
jgi:2-desacetyl-2-hydroxyethyl bacteriochlorophyllide A dehydrogenase